MKKLWVLIGLLLLAGCGDDGSARQLGTQQAWNGVNVAVEARPGGGSNYFEFLVIATVGGNRPAHNLLVYLRVNEDDAWKQAIQDGMVGVYRRAHKVNHPDKDVLFVQLRRGDEQVELRYPLALTP